MQLILNGDTRPIVFFLTSSSDHVTGLTGATPTVTISKNGAAYASPAGTASEIGNGYYKLVPSGADVTTNGVFLLHATATGADPCDVSAQVVAFNPYDAVRMGLTALPSAAAGAAGGLPLGDASGDVTVAGLAPWSSQSLEPIGNCAPVSVQCPRRLVVPSGISSSAAARPSVNRDR